IEMLRMSVALSDSDLRGPKGLARLMRSLKRAMASSDLVLGREITRDAKADAEVAEVRHVAHAHRAPHRLRGIERRAAAQGAHAACGRPVSHGRAVVREARRAVLGTGAVVLAIEVGDPLPDVAVYVVKAPRIGGKRVCGRGRFGIPLAAAAG